MSGLASDAFLIAMRRTHEASPDWCTGWSCSTGQGSPHERNGLAGRPAPGHAVGPIGVYKLRTNTFRGMIRSIVSLLGSALFLSALAYTGPTRYPFSANKGQWPKQVLYRTLTGQGALFVERDALTYVLRSGGHAHGHAKTEAVEERHEHAYRVRFEGGNAGSHEGLEQLPYYENWFIGDKSHWAGHVPVHGAVRLKGLYPGDAYVDWTCAART